MFAAEPCGGPATVHPPRSASNEVSVTTPTFVETDSVEEHPGPLRTPVGHISDRHLDLLARVRRQVYCPVLRAGRGPGGGVPRTGGAGRGALFTLLGLVVLRNGCSS